MIVGGNVLVRQIVPTFQDGFIRNWLRTLDEILALDVAQFVPGHGELMTRRGHRFPQRDAPSIRASRMVSGTARTSARSARRWIFQAGIGSSDHMSSEETSAAPTLRSRRPASASDRNAERNDPLTWSTAEEARRSGRPRHPSGRAQSRTESTGEVADTRAPGRPCLAPTRIGEKPYTSHQRSTA